MTGSPVVAEPTNAEAVALLESASAEQLVLATARMIRETPDRVPGTIALCPVVDGDFLPKRPVEAFRDGSAHPVPLIIGTNEREGSLFRGRLDILASTPSRIRAIFARTPRSRATRLARMYPGLSGRRGAADFAGDYSFWYPSIRVAEGHSRYAPVYFYRFDIAPRMARLLGLDATHGIELFAVFDLARKPFGRVMGVLGGYRDFERTGRRMRANWLHFAYRGSVDAGWPRTTPSTAAPSSSTRSTGSRTIRMRSCGARGATSCRTCSTRARSDRPDGRVQRGAGGISLRPRIRQGAQRAVGADGEGGRRADPGQGKGALALEEGVRADAAGGAALAGELGELRHLGPARIGAGERVGGSGDRGDHDIPAGVHRAEEDHGGLRPEVHAAMPPAPTP